ncbi:MAG TPA: hypothetical protein H9941_00525, partial [Candidatus Flavonifractor avistercoris]|nr:hypothetical protein [Candidatus Flavonifractor avistercoris]
MPNRRAFCPLDGAIFSYKSASIPAKIAGQRPQFLAAGHISDFQTSLSLQRRIEFNFSFFQ